jgi:hypothetical protein
LCGIAGAVIQLPAAVCVGFEGGQTDDTPVAVLDRSLPKTRTGRIWTYVGDEEHPAVVYDCTPTRKRDGPDQFLGTTKVIYKPTLTLAMTIFMPIPNVA